jgi:pimeloyl-ACP methyl ester carboxylesterase
MTAASSDPEIRSDQGWGEDGDRSLRNLLSSTRRRSQVDFLVMPGTQDGVRGYADGEALASCTGGAMVTLEGSGHFPHVRDPVRVNLLIRQFAEGVR